LVISPYFEPSSQDDKVSCVFAVSNYPGALYEALRVFATRGVNLLKLESRPRPGKPWEYLFYVDWEGNLKEDTYQEMIKELSTKTSFWRILGSYKNSWKKN
jgi:chorismate mutase/prephenate dehydratase